MQLMQYNLLKVGLYTPTDYYYGADEFTFQVSDGELTDNRHMFLNAVNDAPVLAALIMYLLMGII